MLYLPKSWFCLEKFIHSNYDVTLKQVYHKVVECQCLSVSGMPPPAECLDCTHKPPFHCASNFVKWLKNNIFGEMISKNHLLLPNFHGFLPNCVKSSQILPLVNPKTITFCWHEFTAGSNNLEKHLSTAKLQMFITKPMIYQKYCFTLRLCCGKFKIMAGFWKTLVCHLVPNVSYQTLSNLHKFFQDQISNDH